MKLRDHPRLSYKSFPIWPPTWNLPRKNGNKILKGEVGVLRYVHFNDGSSKCYLVIDFEAEHYVGTLNLHDQTFCRQISHLLRDHVGRPIKEIGDIDLSFTL
jgi:hypothetical protein